MRVSQTISKTDVSGYYRQNSSARLAKVDTAAICGNLAYAMKNATIIVDVVQFTEQLTSEEPVNLDESIEEDLAK